MTNELLNLLQYVDKWEPVPPPENLEEDILYATHEGKLRIPELPEITVLQLNNGQFIIPEEDIIKLLGGELPNED